MLRTEIYHCTPSQLDEEIYEDVIFDFLMWQARKEAEERSKGGKGGSSGKKSFGG